MSRDLGRGSETLTIDAAAELAERAKVRTTFRVEKWDAEQIAWAGRKLELPKLIEADWRHFRELRLAPFEVFEEEDCNLILNGGWQMIMYGIANDGSHSAPTRFSTTGPVGRIGGGISSTAPAATQTDLQAATGAANRQWEILSAAPTTGSGTGAGNGLGFAATFPTTDGNFAWAEFGVDSGTAAGTAASVAPMLNRGTSSPGTKQNTQTWNVTVAIQWT